MTSVFPITIHRRAVSTPFLEKSSIMVIKILHQVLKDSRKASKSGAETYAKVICLCDETGQEAVAVDRADDHRIPFIAQWLERLIADQQVPGSIQDGDHCLTFMTWSSKLTNQILQMINITSPITTSIRTMTRKSVNMVAEPDNDTAPSPIGRHYRSLSGRLLCRDCSQATERIWSLRRGGLGCSGWEYPHWLGDPQLFECQDDLSESRWTGSGNLHFRLALQTQEQQHSTGRGPVDHSTPQQQHLKTQRKIAREKAAEFKNTTKSLSEELEALAKAKAVISAEDTGSTLSTETTGQRFHRAEVWQVL